MTKILLKSVCKNKPSDGIPVKRHYNYDTVTKSVSYIDELIGSNYCSPYSRPTDELVYSYCSNIDRINVYHDGFGGVELKRVFNGCQVTQPPPVRPALKILSVSVTNQQILGVNDGSITVEVNQGYISWTLTESFSGAIETISSEPIFTIGNLAPGDYVIKVRDYVFHDMIDSYPFTILPKPPDAGPKWFFSFADKDSDLVECDIFGKDFTGTGTEIEYVDPAPIVIETKGKGKDKYSPIRSTECILHVVAVTDFEYITIFSSDDKEHFVKIKRAGSLFWAGYIVSDVYTEPYINPPYKMLVSCTDGLVYLKNYDFDLLKEYASYLEIIQYCLDKLDYQLPLKDSTVIRPHELDLLTSPLVTQLVKPEIYHGTNCYEVLEKVLFANLSRLYQSGGYWYVSPIDTLTDTYTERTFDVNGTFLSETIINPLKLIAKPNQGDVYFIDKSQNLTVNPAYREVQIEQELGLNDNLIKNPEFKFKGIGGGWANPANYEDRSYRDGKEIKTARVFTEGTLRQHVFFNPEHRLSRFEFKIEFMVNAIYPETTHMIRFSFKGSQADHYIGILINGTYYNYVHDGYSIPYGIVFKNWLESLPNFSHYYKTAYVTDDEGYSDIEITSLYTDASYDFGDVETDKGVTITARSNSPVTNFDNAHFRVSIQSAASSLTSTGFWGTFYVKQKVLLGDDIMDAREMRIPISKSGEWESFTVITDPLPSGMQSIEVQIYGIRLNDNKHEVPNYDGANIIENAVRKVELTLLPEGRYAPSSYAHIVPNENEKTLSFAPAKYELFTGGVINESPVNAKKIYNNLVYRKDGTEYIIAKFFKEGNNDNIYYLFHLLARLILSASAKPTQVITGRLVKEVFLHHSFYDNSNPGKIFITNYVRLDMRHKRNDIEIIEMAGADFTASVTTGILLEDGEFLLKEDGYNLLLEG